MASKYRERGKWISEKAQSSFLMSVFNVWQGLHLHSQSMLRQSLSWQPRNHGGILGNPMSDQHFQTIATAGANVGSCRPARECRRNDASNWQGEWPDASCLCSLHFLLWHDQRFHWRSTQVACSVLLHDDLLLSLPGGLVCSSQVAIWSSWRCEYVGLCSVSGFLIELRVRQPLGRVKIFF